MSLINKLGLEKYSNYKDLEDINNRLNAHNLELVSKIIKLEKQMENMSDVSIYNKKLIAMNKQYEDMRLSFASHVEAQDVS